MNHRIILLICLFACGTDIARCQQHDPDTTNQAATDSSLPIKATVEELRQSGQANPTERPERLPPLRVISSMSLFYMKFERVLGLVVKQQQTKQGILIVKATGLTLRETDTVTDGSGTPFVVQDEEAAVGNSHLTVLRWTVENSPDTDVVELNHEIPAEGQILWGPTLSEAGTVVWQKVKVTGSRSELHGLSMIYGQHVQALTTSLTLKDVLPEFLFDANGRLTAVRADTSFGDPRWGGMSAVPAYLPMIEAADLLQLASVPLSDDFKSASHGLKVARLDLMRPVQAESFLLTWSDQHDELQACQRSDGHITTLKIEPRELFEISTADNACAVHLGTQVAGYSSLTESWDVLVLPKSSRRIYVFSQNQKLYLSGADHYYEFSEQAGRWISPTDQEIDVKRLPVESPGAATTIPTSAPGAEEFLRLEIVKAELALENAKSQLGRNHPDMLNLKQQLERLNAKLLAVRDSRAKSADPDTPNSLEHAGDDEPKIADRTAIESARETAENQHQSAEVAAHQAAIEYRAEAAQESPDVKALADLKQKLETSVKTAFDAQMKLQQLRLQLAELDLAEVKAKHLRRESLAAKIIERRVADLMRGENLEWLSSKEATLSLAETMVNGVERPGFKQLEGTVWEVRGNDFGVPLNDSFLTQQELASNPDVKWFVKFQQGKFRLEAMLNNQWTTFWIAVVEATGTEGQFNLSYPNSSAEEIDETMRQALYVIDGDRLELAIGPQRPVNLIPGEHVFYLEGKRSTVPTSVENSVTMGSVVPSTSNEKNHTTISETQHNDEALNGNWMLKRINSARILGQPHLLRTSPAEWILIRGADESRFTRRLRTDVEPHLVDLFRKETPDAPPMFSGIYKIDDNTLTIAWAPSDGSAPRPTDFRGHVGTVDEWKRIRQLPTFATPEELLAFWEQVGGPNETMDLEQYLAVIDNNELSRVAGFLLRCISMLQVSATYAGPDYLKANGGRFVVLSSGLSDIVHRSIMPQAGTDSLAALQYVSEANQAFNFRRSRQMLDVSDYSHKLSLAAFALYDNREFVFDVLTFLNDWRFPATTHDDAPNGSPVTEWKIIRHRDTATAVNQRNAGAINRLNIVNELLTAPRTIMLEQRDDTWVITKILPDEVLIHIQDRQPVVRRKDDDLPPVPFLSPMIAQAGLNTVDVAGEVESSDSMDAKSDTPPPVPVE